MNRLLFTSGPLRQSVRNLSKEITRVDKPAKKFTIVGNKFVRARENMPEVQEEIGHTGSYFDDKDWRRNRYIGKTKHVNPNWAIEMVAEIPPIEVDGRVAICEGRDGPDGAAALGHPKVYINLDSGKPQSCMYCGLRYVKKLKAH